MYVFLITIIVIFSICVILYPIFFNNKKRKWEVIFRPKTFERNDMYVDEIKHFLKCVKNRKKTINTLEEGINTMNIALAMKKSAKLKKMVKIKSFF